MTIFRQRVHRRCARRCRRRCCGQDRDKAKMQQQDLWTAGEGGYHTYRIPALCVTTKGAGLAFTEGRKHSRSDWGEIDVLVRRSTDGGKTWGAAMVAASDPGMTVGNPAPVVDASTGTI